MLLCLICSYSMQLHNKISRFFSAAQGKGPDSVKILRRLFLHQLRKHCIQRFHTLLGCNGQFR